MSKKENSKEMQKLISEITSLEDDLKEFRKSIKKVKEAPYKKQGESEVVGTQHEELVTELEDIASRLEELPKKWEGEK